MPSARRATVLLAVALLLVTAVATVSVVGRESPRPVCGVCTDALDRAGTDAGVAVERVRAEMTIRVGSDASTRWTARVTLESGAAALRNDSLRRAVVSDAIERARGVADPANVTSRIQGRVLVVSYRDPEAATRRAGVVLFTALHSSDPLLPMVGGGEGTPYPGADSLVVVGPEEHVIVGEYAGTNGSRETVRWEGEGASIDRKTVVAFVPEGSALPGVRATVARWAWTLTR